MMTTAAAPPGDATRRPGKPPLSSTRRRRPATTLRAPLVLGVVPYPHERRGAGVLHDHLGDDVSNDHAGIEGGPGSYKIIRTLRLGRLRAAPFA
jgi:hypothetical protein